MSKNSLTRSLCETNSDIQEVYDKDDNYRDVMDISLINCRKSSKLGGKRGSNGKAPRSPDVKHKKRLDKLQKEVKEMRAWEEKIV